METIQRKHIIKPMARLDKISKEALKELYDKDFVLWVEENLELLREGDYGSVDWENLLEEIEDMARRHIDSAISYLAIILEHLYKLEHFRGLVGGETAGSGWVKSALNARDRLNRLLAKYPSLKQKLPNAIQQAWEDAVVRIRIWLRNNGKDPDSFSIPKNCPYTYEEATTTDVKKVFDKGNLSQKE